MCIRDRFSIEIKRPNTEQQVLAELETTVYTYSCLLYTSCT